jgi:tetratricopeptide (TPR) repeat protein
MPHLDAAWHSRPVFLSSTFRDMHAERDYLHTRVFPELAERLRSRCHHLELIDLRWGVETVSLDENQSKELMVLKVCLAEIERSRPFLVVLLGDRYGWVPPEERLAAAAAEVGFTRDLLSMSVTELEIEFGALSGLGGHTRARFYFREGMPYDEMDPEVAARYSDAWSPQPAAREAHERLQSLKDRIRTALPDRVREYRPSWDRANRRVTGLEAWGAQVLEDLWHDLEEETHSFAVPAAESWQEHEERALSESVALRLRDFVDRAEVLEELLGLARSPLTRDAPWGVCVVGPAGVGKSSIFARLHAELKADDVLLLAHSAGLTQRSTELRSLLALWSGTLGRELGIEDPTHEISNESQLAQTFADLLSRVAVRRRVICLIDGLDRLERSPRTRAVSWLPLAWPANARLIATVEPGSESDALGQRHGVVVRPLPLFRDDAIRAMATALCARYRKTLHPEVLAALLGKQQKNGEISASLPQWLALAIEELVLLDEDAFERAELETAGTPERRLHDLVVGVAASLPADVASLYSWIISRAERVFGQSWTQAFLGLMALGRSGWRDSDMKTLMPLVSGEPWEGVRHAAIRRILRSHLISRPGGQLDFANPRLRQAVLERVLAAPERKQMWEKAIAHYLHELPVDDPLRRDELMRHLLAARDAYRVAHFYGSLSQHRLGLDVATSDLADHLIDDPGAPDWIASLLGTPDLTETELLTWAAAIAGELLPRLADRAPIDAAVKFGVRVLGPLANRCPAATLGLQERMAALLRACGAPEGARKLCEELLRCYEGMLEEAPDSPVALRAVIDAHFRLGDIAAYDLTDYATAADHYDAASALVPRLCAVAAEASVQDELFIGLESRRATIYEKTGQLEKALSVRDGALRCLATLRMKSPESAYWAVETEKLSVAAGDTALLLNDPGRARAAFENAILIGEQLVLAYPEASDYARDLAMSHEGLAGALLRVGEPTAALPHYQRAADIFAAWRARVPDNARFVRGQAIEENKLADLYIQYGIGSADQTRERLERTYALRLDLWQRHGDDASARDLEVSCGKLGNLLLDSDPNSALGFYRKALELAEICRGPAQETIEHLRDLGIGHQKIGDALLRLANHAAAREQQEQSLALFRQLQQLAPGNTQYARDIATALDRIGDLDVIAGELGHGVERYLEALAIIDRLRTQSPENAILARDEVIFCHKLTLTYAMLGDRRSTFRYTACTYAGVERMARAGMALDTAMLMIRESLKTIPAAFDQDAEDAFRREQFADSREILELLATMAEAAGDTERLLITLSHLAMPLRRLADETALIKLTERVHALCEAGAAWLNLVDPLTQHAALLFEQQRFQECLGVLKKQEALLRRIHHAEALAHNLANQQLAMARLQGARFISRT